MKPNKDTNEECEMSLEGHAKKKRLYALSCRHNTPSLVCTVGYSADGGRQICQVLIGGTLYIAWGILDYKTFQRYPWSYEINFLNTKRRLLYLKDPVRTAQ